MDSQGKPASEWTPELVRIERRLNEYINAMQSPRMTAWQPQFVPQEDGRKGLVIGQELFLVPSEQTFHTSCVDYLRHQLNEHWIATQRQRPPTQRHAIVRWLDALAAEIASGPPGHGGSEGVVVRIPSGATRALAMLADDIIQLRNVGRLDRGLLRRLRGGLSFQGARYEMLVAALFCRAGFQVEWVARDPRKKTPEFLAILPSTRERFHVEAKSIHRPDSLHGGGGAQSTAAEARPRALTEFVDALTHAVAGIPLLVFVDPNVPATSWPSAKESGYMAAIEGELESRSARGIGEEDCSAVFLTNFGWYFSGGEEAPPGGTVAHRVARAKTLISDEAITRLMYAAQESGIVPDEEQHQERVRSRFPEFR